MARVCEIVRNELLILVGPHHGHCAGRCPAARGIELDGFGTWTRFDKSLQFDNRFGRGGLLGDFLRQERRARGRRLDNSDPLQERPAGDSSYIPIRVRLAAHVPLGSSYSRLTFGAQLCGRAVDR